MVWLLIIKHKQIKKILSPGILSVLGFSREKRIIEQTFYTQLIVNLLGKLWGFGNTIKIHSLEGSLVEYSN